MPEPSRRRILAAIGAGGALAALGIAVRAERPTGAPSTSITGAPLASQLDRIADPEIRAGTQIAIEKNLLTAIVQKLYPGQFTISADGSAYGADSTWPGLDSWQMAGAYLLLGRTQLVLDYFDFVRASQRPNGDIPWAIFTGETRPDTTWLRGLEYPEGLFEYTPPKRHGLPESASQKRTWIGMCKHWQPQANPLSNLGATCYVLTADEIFAATGDSDWLADQLPSLERAASYLDSRTSENGLIPGSGFYQELPPRRGWDGLTQCYVAHAFRKLESLYRKSGDDQGVARWRGRAGALGAKFIETFWRGDHFAEYVHFERGLVDSHGLSDVNFAAVAFNIATDAHCQELWPILMSDTAFWAGDVPTQSVTKPLNYEEWEYHEALPFGAPPTKDAAAMGRVWYLEVEACRRMNETKRIIDGARLVCRMANDGYWRERYIRQKDGKVVPAYADHYCEYPAVLVRTVIGMSDLFA